MEENRESLKGKQVAWHKDIKEQIFATDKHITVKKITDKAGNMKRTWKAAKAMQEQSGWGVKATHNTESVNDKLEEKCPFFWRL